MLSRKRKREQKRQLCSQECSGKGLSPANNDRMREIAAARNIVAKGEFWIQNQMGTAEQFVQVLGANHDRLNQLFPDGVVS